jgi:23S rRNA pseudouridine2605 synthase
MAHPRFQVEKEYIALVDGRLTDRELRRLRDGILIDDEETAPAHAEHAAPPPGYAAHAQQSWVRLIIHEGRKRQVRRMLAATGHQVRTLVRVRIGAVQLAKLATGKTRRLTHDEVAALREAIGLPNR